MHARPLAVLVIMSTQIMRGDWCWIYIYLPTYPPERKEKRPPTREERADDATRIPEGYKR